MLEIVLDSEPSHCQTLRWRGDLHRYMAEDKAAMAVYKRASDAMHDGGLVLHATLVVPCVATEQH